MSSKDLLQLRIRFARLTKQQLDDITQIYSDWPSEKRRAFDDYYNGLSNVGRRLLISGMFAKTKQQLETLLNESLEGHTHSGQESESHEEHESHESHEKHTSHEEHHSHEAGEPNQLSSEEKEKLRKRFARYFLTETSRHKAPYKFEQILFQTEP